MYTLSVNLNWPLIGVVVLAVIILLVFVNRRNAKDKREMEKTLNNVEENPEREGIDDEKV